MPRPDDAQMWVRLEPALMFARRCLTTPQRLSDRDTEELGEALDLLLSGATEEAPDAG